MYAVPLEQTARGLGLYSLETGYSCVILDGWRHISMRMPAWVFLNVCRSVWSLAFPSPEASEPCPRAPSLGLLPSPMTYELLIQKQKAHTQINEKAKDPNWKTYLLWGSFFTQRWSKTNAARRPQTSSVPSHRLTMITELRLLFFVVCFFFSSKEREWEWERKK